MTKVFVTSVPTEFCDIVQVFAESDSQGGGRLKSFDYDFHKQCVNLEFVNETDANKFIEKKCLKILSHEMRITKAPCASTIFVYDVPPNFKDDLDCILESPRKGGGPIKTFIFMDKLNCAEVTFEDSAVAESFVNKGVLKMGSKMLPISYLPPSIYRPQFQFYLMPVIIRKEAFEQIENIPPFDDVDSISQHSLPCAKVKEDSSNESLVLQAINLPTVLKSDYLKMVLENKRYGGSALKFYKFFEKERVAHFSFVCDQVAQDMLKVGVVDIGGGDRFQVQKLVEDSFYETSKEIPEESTRNENNEKCGSVGLKHEFPMNREQILLYAENKRSDGGPVVNLVEINPSLSVINFKFFKDAESFSKKDHSAFFRGKTNTILLDSWPEDVKPCAIYVEGFKQLNNDVLKLYFENPRSGGKADSVEQVVAIAAGVVCIVFKDSNVVTSILEQGSWKLGSDELKIVACHPNCPPPILDSKLEIDPYLLRFTGIKLSSFNHKEFKEYVSLAAQANVDHVISDKESDSALVKFTDVPNYVHVMKTLCSRPFSGIMISVEKVPVADSILVTSVSRSDISIELLKLYFENSRSGGGPIKDARLDLAKNAYVVQFKDPKVVHRVVGKTHKCGEETFEVRPHLGNRFFLL